MENSVIRILAENTSIILNTLDYHCIHINYRDLNELIDTKLIHFACHKYIDINDKDKGYLDNTECVIMEIKDFSINDIEGVPDDYKGENINAFEFVIIRSGKIKSKILVAMPAIEEINKAGNSALLELNETLQSKIADALSETFYNAINKIDEELSESKQNDILKEALNIIRHN